MGESENSYPVRKHIFGTYAAAETVFRRIKNTAISNGAVSVEEYYDFCEKDYESRAVYKDTLYGWRASDIDKMAILRGDDGYTVKLPDAIKL